MSLYLHDTTGRKKSQDHLSIMAEKRRYQIRVAEMLEKCVLAETYRRVLECGFRVTVLEDDEGSTRFDTGFFCKHRMCPACAWRKSMGTAVVLTAISGAMVADGYTPLMVTLTAPNCEADQLDDEILRYNHAWDKLIRRKRYRDAWGNNVRKLEVTYNQQSDTYHPHLHVMVFVRPGYFKGGERGNYISRAQLLSDWRKAYGNNNITQVDVRKAYGTDGKNIAELSKYVAKASDFLFSEEVFKTFYYGLYGKRLFGYSGCCKDLRAAYKAGELREYIDRDTTRYAWRVMYQDISGSGDYQETDRQIYDAMLEDDEGIEIAAAWAYMED